jgi:glyoxylate utilization-related uncharacterized protein
MASVYAIDPLQVGYNVQEIANKLGALSQLIQTGTITLVAGTITVATGITITSGSRILLTRTAQGGTSATVVDYMVTAKTVGAPGTGAFTVTAATGPGVTVATDTSTLDYIIIG